jgi:FMN phosphatase YigB (HAD superfamily)
MIKKRFREFVGSGTLTIFDIDETLFHTKAKVAVVKDGKVVRMLDNQEFNTYKRKDGEEYDFREFKSAEVFRLTPTSVRKARPTTSESLRAQRYFARPRLQSLVWLQRRKRSLPTRRRILTAG